MKKNEEHTRIDIEELLIQKPYNMLSSNEKEYVDTQVDSPQEYAELRATLISVKEWAKEEKIVVAEAKIKEKLMAQMEEKSSRISWWERIGVFLFPPSTSIFKKPGFQFAVMSLLVLLVVNIGIQQFEWKRTQLAENSNQEISEKENIQPNQFLSDTMEEMDDNLESENETMEKPEAKEIELLHESSVQNNAPAAPIDLILEEANNEIIENAKSVVQEDEIQGGMEVLLDEDSRQVLDEITPPISGARGKANFKITGKVSQNLASQEEVIDLLFIAL